MAKEKDSNLPKKKNPWSTFGSPVDYIKYLYMSDPRNWTKNLAQICRENELEYETINAALDRYGWDKFKEELRELRAQYIQQTIEVIANHMLDATKLALEHIYQELDKGGEKKWKAMWHLREFIKAFAEKNPLKAGVEDVNTKIRYEKVIITRRLGDEEVDTKSSEETWKVDEDMSEDGV